mgnify:CR=1 FL=1
MKPKDSFWRGRIEGLAAFAKSLLGLGVFQPNQYCPIPGFGGASRICYRLLHSQHPPSPEESAIFETLIRHLRLSSGVYRTTFRGRFAGLNLWVNQHILQRFPSSTNLDVHDWAASDCLTSAEWLLSLAPNYPGLRLTASDLTLHLIEIELPSGESYIVEPEGKALQYIRPPFVIALDRPEPIVFPINRFLQQRARRRLEGHQSDWAPALEEFRRSQTQERLRPPFRFRRIPLVHPEAQRAQKTFPQFRVCQHSVFDPLAEPCHVLRTMNILNRVYFSREQLRRGVEAARLSVREGGLWIVGRTPLEPPIRHNATIFLKSNGAFQALDRMGEGSEMEDLVSC